MLYRHTYNTFSHESLSTGSPLILRDVKTSTTQWRLYRHTGQLYL